MAVWGKVTPGGAWADNVDEEEAAGTLAGPPKAFLVPGKVKEDDFPDLAAAAKVKESKKDKKKKAAKQTLSLTDFLKSDVGGGPTLGGSRRGGGDIDLLSLPTAPRPRVEGEERPDRPLGGGFREYGGGRDGRFGDDERRPRRGEEEDMGPSRAEMSNNWGADRKPTAGGSDDRGRSGFDGGFRDGGGGFRDREGGGFRDRSRDAFPSGPSRADEADDWGKTKAFVPSSGGGGASRGFDDRPRGGGYRERSPGGYRERSPGAFREPSRADTEDRWSKSSGADFKPTAFEDRPCREFDDRVPPRRGFGFGDRPGSRDGSRDARPCSHDISEDRSWRPAGGTDSPVRERPRLNLAPRSTAVPLSAVAPAGGVSKSSVFGAARPREEVLKEQGRDAMKEDLALEHEAVGRRETAEEKALRQQITHLQVRMEAGEADAEYEGATTEAEDNKEGKDCEGEEGTPPKTVTQVLENLEARLQRLQLELDAKAKYARAAPGAADSEHAKERAPRMREPSPAGESGWRRSAPNSANGGSAPRGFRDDRPARPAGGASPEDRPPRSRGYEEHGERGERSEHVRRDNFPPRDSDTSCDKPRW